MQSHRLSNAATFLAIAREAQTESERAGQSEQVFTADGTAAVVTRFDPTQRSFRHGLVALVFASMYLEALFYQEGIRRLGAKYDDWATYKDKALALGIDDAEILSGCTRLQEVRRSIVHEKSVSVWEVSAFVKLQPEAAAAVALAERIAGLLEAGGR